VVAIARARAPFGIYPKAQQARCSAANVGPKSAYRRPTRTRIFCSKPRASLRSDGRPRNPWTAAWSPCFLMRRNSQRTWRSDSCNGRPASVCVKCLCCTPCSTLNRSRSIWLKAIRSVSTGPRAIHESGHLYFAQNGHSHFAPTAQSSCLTLTSHNAKIAHADPEPQGD
jgi:hypothetical protein